MVMEKMFRVGLKKQIKDTKIVAPFSFQSNTSNARVPPPPRCHVFRERNVNNSLFRKYYLRGDIPIGKSYNKKKLSNSVLIWKVPPEELDYCHYLPIFFDGLSESIEPYKTFARHGVNDMLMVGGDKILPAVPYLLMPIRKALNTRNPDVIKATLKAIRLLLKSAPCSGIILVPYYRQILSIFNLFYQVNVNIGDKVDYQKDGQIGDCIEDTLQMLELYGGNDAYINIKYMIPLYESFVNN